MRDAAVHSGNHKWTKHGIAGSFAAAVARGGIVKRRHKEYDRRIAKMAKEKYPETALLEQVKGVGDLIATTYVLTVEDPTSFPEESRRGMFCGVAARAEELRRQRATDAH
jgi:Transposase IS116/IS110/IS902 family